MAAPGVFAPSARNRLPRPAASQMRICEEVKPTKQSNSMTDEKWEALKEELKRKFKVEDEHFEDLEVETADGPIKRGQIEVLIFESPIGKVKLARESHPVVLDKKEFYSHQQGKAARIEYVFSETDFVHKIKAYKWDDYNDEWKEMDAQGFAPTR